MASLIESFIRNEIYKGFKGRLLTGTLRRLTPSAAKDSKGDPVSLTPETFGLEGIVDTYSAFQKAQAGIPESDVKLLVIAGSLSVRPNKDDQVKFRDTWYQVRQVGTDPALATWELQSFEIADPT